MFTKKAIGRGLTRARHNRRRPRITRAPFLAAAVPLSAGRQYDETGQSEPWKNEVAKDLNQLIARVDFVASDPRPVDVDHEFVQAAGRIIDRVAEFEGIKEVEARRK